MPRLRRRARAGAEGVCCSGRCRAAWHRRRRREAQRTREREIRALLVAALQLLDTSHPRGEGGDELFQVWGRQ